MTRLKRLQQDKERITQQCLLDYQQLKDHYNLTAVDVSKKKELDVDSRAFPQIVFYRMLKTNSQVCAVLITKRNDARVLQRKSKSSENNINGGIQ